MKSVYLTTPIYYPNDKPHIGTAYTTIVTDVLSRYFKFFEYDTRFLTGTDEHGQKIQQAAEARGMSPQEHCDDVVLHFKEAWKELEIDFDVFFRTTNPDHVKAVQACLQKIYDKGEIYSDSYEGWYCVSEEVYYTEKDLVDGKSPSGKEVTKVSEQAYFFKMSAYQERLIKHIEEHPDFIQPESRRNEVLGFLRQPLGDLCISRPKSRLSWGVELPFDKDYVTYVWFDALLNYVHGAGGNELGPPEEFNKWWAGAEARVIHLLGKDILTTHAVYWPTILMALEIPLPTNLFAHGWILNKDNAKMSKSAGDVINPLDMKDVVGVDALRYFLIREIHLGNDAPFSQELVTHKINTDLANNLGNLLSRTTNLIAKYYDGRVENLTSLSKPSNDLKDQALTTADKVKADIERLAPSYATSHVVEILNKANRYLEEMAPWKVAKEDPDAAKESLMVALEIVRIAGLLLRPVMPSKCRQLLEQLGCEKQGYAEAKIWGKLNADYKIEKGKPLFPRV